MHYIRDNFKDIKRFLRYAKFKNKQNTHNRIKNQDLKSDAILVPEKTIKVSLISSFLLNKHNKIPFVI